MNRRHLHPVIPVADESRHPLIVRSRRKHPSSQAEGPLYLEIGVSEPLRDQALRIAAALVEACETRRYDFKPTSDAIGGIATINVFGNRIGVSINEPLLSVPHVLTKTEAREKALGRGWNIPEHDSQPSGQIEIVLDHSISGERRTFSCPAAGAGGTARARCAGGPLGSMAHLSREPTSRSVPRCTPRRGRRGG